VEADVAIVSVPGEYAALEAHKALGAGADVLLFSDGVSLDDEVALKTRAHSLGQIVMGPGAGTAIVDGVGLGFANTVASGPVGVVAAAGTGAQEVTVLLERFGSGITQCYGTGGRDLYEEVAARTALDAIARLAEDDATKVILCVSKPPAPAVADAVVAALGASGKPAVACFVGGAADSAGSVHLVPTLDEAARAAAQAAGASATELPSPTPISPRTGVVRGLFSGGTLCSEAAAILSDALGRVVSNAPAGSAQRLDPEAALSGHACLDLGEEEYTRGRPHPMIDPEARAEQILAQVEDPELAVLLFDVVLGFGSHPDPAGVLIEALAPVRQARPDVAVVAHVLGTNADAQVVDAQEAALQAGDVTTAASNALAARAAAAAIV
jgi:FdrA protein